MIVISLSSYLLPRVVSRRITLSYQGPWGMISKRDVLASAEVLGKPEKRLVSAIWEDFKKIVNF
jgi:hypothetical protein